MIVLINGEKRTVTAGSSIQKLLEQLAINPSAVVVERNESVLPRDCFSETFLVEGDKLEIVQFVGGGN